MKRALNTLCLMLVGLLVLQLSGCSKLYRMQTNMTLRFVENRLIPPVLASRDIDMACMSGVSQAPLFISIGQSAERADYFQLAGLLISTASICADQQELESDLRAYRASRNGSIEVAKDALYEQQRWATLSAERQYRAYRYYGEYLKKHKQPMIGDGCPKFQRDFDEMIYMLTLMTGMQAVANDIKGKSQVGVPTDIAAKVDRGMSCLNNEKWFGVPLATQAAIWNILPGAGAGEDPWQTLEQSIVIGERKGVRLTHALYVLSAYIQDDKDKLRQGLRRFAATKEDEKFKPNQVFGMFDAIGEHLVISIADRYWAENTGTRMPAGGLSRFWDDAQGLATPGIDISDLLE